MHSVRAEGPDKPGLGARITQALAEAGVNLRGLSAAAIGKKCVVYLAIDTAEGAAEAAKVLKKIK
jgi:predicted amino acid-binding ACT domain protein